MSEQDPACDNCRWCIKEVNEHEEAECRRFPPTLADGHDLNLADSWGSPVVYLGIKYFCGEFQPNNPPRQQWRAPG